MSDEREVTARVSELRTDIVSSIFIALVPRGGAMPADTIISTDAHVDVDDCGNVIGVTVMWRDT